MEEFERVFSQVKNWGRWGNDDVLGTLNFLTPERRMAALSCVRTGRQISLGHPVNPVAGPDNPRPAIHLMSGLHDPAAGVGFVRFATDFLGIDMHGDSHSHLDALCHVSYRGLLYNGRDAASVTSKGAAHLGIESYAEGIVGRGVLLDIPRSKGVEWLEPGEAVTRSDLEAAEQAFDARVGPGDILVFRTGHDRRRRVLGPWDTSPQGAGKAGLAVDAIPWLHEREIAAFLPDGDGETVPFPVDGVQGPIHALQIVAMGLAAADSLDLEALALACAEEKRHEFLLFCAPIRLIGGTASLINPIALL